ncbi:MAG TPA: acyl-CoA dehydrogenase, partial [Gammaproteobacteria bacterium]|nr:acyl-CoA dehydrogenase [Gammaproteobacteria bacterium]
MESLVWLVLFVAVPIGLAYRRTELATSTIVLGVLLLIYTLLGDADIVGKTVLWVVFAAFASLNSEAWRRERFTRRLIGVYRRMLPSMSRTEQDALEAGGIWWDGELFSGIPDWRKLLRLPPP